MKINFLYVLIFLAGMIAQAVSMLAGKWESGDLRKTLFSMATGLIGLMPGKHENNYDIRFHLVFACVIAAFSFTGAFRKKLVSFIGARSLITLNIIMLFLIYQKIGLIWPIFGVLLIPSVITLINGFTNIDRHFGWQVFFYAWFSMLVFLIGVTFFAFGDMFRIFGWDSGGNISSPIGVFLMGSAFLYIISNAWFVIELIPYTEKHQTMAARMVQIRKHMQLLAYGYIWKSGDILGNLIILIVLPIFIYLNYQFRVMSDHFLVSAILAFMPLLNRVSPVMEIKGDGIGDVSLA